MPPNPKEVFIMSTATLSVQSTKDEAEILSLVESLHQANYDKNAAAFAAPFAPDAAVFNLAPPLVHHGIDVAEKRTWFNEWATPVNIESRDLHVTTNGDLALVHGFLRMRGTKKGSDRPVDFWMRETLCLERKGSRWQIVHEHTSVPFHMDATLRPAFDLQP
jgi:ketosteroid isomerase-like protein